MSPKEGAPSSSGGAEPSPDRCPNCNRVLRYPADQPEAYCPSCGIFVEILRPLPEAPSGERPTEDDKQRLQTARMYLELDDVLGGDLDEQPVETPEAEPRDDVSSEIAAEPEPAAQEPELVVVPLQLEEPEGLAGPSEVPGPREFAEPVPSEVSATASAEAAARSVALPRRWHRIAFYTGSVLVAFGGSGLALGSVLHDAYRVPFFGYAFEVFGSLNVSTAVVGLTVLFAGFAAMGIGALAGRRPRSAAGG